MKRFLIMSIAIFSFISATGQAVDIRTEQHQIIFIPQTLLRCTQDGTITDNKPMPIQRWWTFSVVDTVDNNYIIQFNRWKNDKALNNDYFKDTTNNNPIYFRMSKEYYQKYASVAHKKSQFTVAASTTFVKVRPGKKEPRGDGVNIYSELTNDFNVGAMAGLTLSPYKSDVFKLHILGGLSYSSINLNDYNTNKFLTSETANSAITPSIAFVGEYQKFQIGLFSGIDILSGEAGRHFIYRNRPWFGLGFGFSIFRPNASASSDQDTKSPSATH